MAAPGVLEDPAVPEVPEVLEDLAVPVVLGVRAVLVDRVVLGVRAVPVDQEALAGRAEYLVLQWEDRANKAAENPVIPFPCGSWNDRVFGLRCISVSFDVNWKKLL
ncbi:hypothetical protein [Gorillibacterium timonense]|uniref:hypothetical protein n=1 Tax=Gorillibacterium timonense TaxID=1689269 RepID=UPI00071C2EA9|nr:hypothetical protein [Gorillibacterium timonense]